MSCEIPPGPRVTATAGQGPGARQDRSGNVAAVTLSGQDPWQWGDAGAVSRRRLPLPALGRRNVILLRLDPCQRDSGGTRSLHLDKLACQLQNELLPQWKKQPFCLRRSVKVRNIAPLLLCFPSALGWEWDPPHQALKFFSPELLLWGEDKGPSPWHGDTEAACG